MKDTVFIKPASFLALSVLVITALISASCASYPERYSSDECLVVIKTTVNNPENLTQGRDFHFTLSNGQKTKSISGGYLAFKVIEPGIKISAISSSVSSNYTGSSSRDEIDLPLPYAPGEVVVADFVFVHDFRRRDSSTIISAFDFRRISPDEADKLVEILRGKRQYSSWFEDPGTFLLTGIR